MPDTSTITASSRRRVRDRLGARLALTVLVAVPAATAAGLIAVAVESAWNPFRGLDQRTAAALHRQTAAHPAWTHVLSMVTNYGSPTTFQVLVGLLAVGLWMRGARRL